MCLCVKLNVVLLVSEAKPKGLFEVLFSDDSDSRKSNIQDNGGEH